ncbi:MAG: hypothetical protein KDK34_02895, partial [Leptospiraceae bacterium]|nr:hypothetical protein [Leptospiraceae bacterium]
MKAVLFTADRRQLPCVDFETLRKLDRLATTDFGLSTAQLMESAGRNVTGLLLELWAAEGRNLRDTQVLFLIGPGRNGGNGLCAARHLANRGLQVSFLLSA